VKSPADEVAVGETPVGETPVVETPVVEAREQRRCPARSR
jgi:hypothetical protein